MKFNAKIKLYTISLAFLSVTAVLALVFGAQASFQRQSQEALLPDLQGPAVLASLSIEGGASLAQKDGQWTVLQNGEKFPANQERIQGFVKSLKELTRQQIVSTGEDLTPFGLDSHFKRLVGMGSDGKELFNLLIGKASADERGVYVKFDKQKAVYLTDRAFSRSLELDFNTWTDLRLFLTPVNAQDIIKMELTGGPLLINGKTIAPYTLTRTVSAEKKPVWVLSGSSSAPVGEGDGLASSLASRQISGYLKASDSFDPNQPLAVLTLGFEKGPDLQFKIGAMDLQNRFPVYDGARRFYLAQWALDQMLYKPAVIPPVSKP